MLVAAAHLLCDQSVPVKLVLVTVLPAKGLGIPKLF